MKRDLYITVCPFTLEVAMYDDLKSATEDSIRKNAASEDHPAYRLFLVSGPGPATYLGRLWKGVGVDFDLENCWRKRS